MNNPKKICVADYFMVWIALTAVLFCLNSGLFAQSPAVNQNELHTDELERLIDSLANHNDPPKIIENFSIDNSDDKYHLVLGNDLPIFSEKYDWAEQRRVLEACKALVKQNGGDLWPHLIDHLDDKRYAFTCTLEDCGKNISIGDICKEVAYSDLMYPFNKFRPNNIIPAVNGNLFFFTAYHDLKGWCHAHQGKALWELQVEIGEWWIKTIENSTSTLDSHNLKERTEDGTSSDCSKNTNKEVKEVECIGKTKEAIVLLRQSKEPIVNKRHGPYFDQAHYFNEQEAKEVRQEYLNRVSAGLGPKPNSSMDNQEGN